MGFDAAAEKEKLDEKRRKETEKAERLAKKQAAWQEKFDKSEAQREARKSSITAAFICSQCGHLGKPKLITKGSLVAEIVAWLFCLILIPFTFGLSLIFCIVYSIWRHLSRFKGCPQCQGGMIKTSSPVGQKMVSDYHKP